MESEFLHFISDKKLCTAKDKILLAVSGGIDSMAMLHLFQQSGFSISVAHANFQLRGKESEGDEQFIKTYCQENLVPCFTKRFDTEEFASEKSLSIQMAARELRYTWFNELFEANGFDLVATAHHLNDSIETSLLNFVRGSSIEGLDGIAPKNGRFIRPMLFATREQIESYAHENKISWREDSSNSSDDYQRNFIRHKIVPLLKELNPSLVSSFQDAAEKISGANELMELGIRHWREQLETRKDDQILFSKSGFDGFHNPDGLLWNLIKSYGFNLDQCKQIIKALHGQPGKKFLSHEFELVVDREHLIISMHENQLQGFSIEKGQTEARLGKYVLKISEVENKSISKDPFVANLDAEKIRFPLTWRKWKAGDSFHPLGMDHKKKLSDFFIDQKISRIDKESISVLESGNEIAWVIGHRVDDRYKITESTKRYLKIEVTSAR